MFPIFVDPAQPLKSRPTTNPKLLKRRPLLCRRMSDRNIVRTTLFFERDVPNADLVPELESTGGSSIAVDLKSPARRGPLSGCDFFELRSVGVLLELHDFTIAKSEVVSKLCARFSPAGLKE